MKLEKDHEENGGRGALLPWGTFPGWSQSWGLGGQSSAPASGTMLYRVRDWAQPALFLKIREFSRLDYAA